MNEPSPSILASASPLTIGFARASTYVVPDVYWLLRRYTRDMATVLDVGCGAETSPFRFVPVASEQRRVGLDHFQPAVERSQRIGIHNEYMVADVFAELLLQPKSFDCVTAIDVVEHFEKDAGYRLLQRIEGLARRRVIVFTPNGFLKQEPFDGNESQRHLSGWTVDDLQSLGYRVFGAHGLKSLRGEYALPVLKPFVVGTMLSMLTQFVTLALPRTAFHLFAVKDIS